MSDEVVTVHVERTLRGTVTLMRSGKYWFKAEGNQGSFQVEESEILRDVVDLAIDDPVIVEPTGSRGIVLALNKTEAHVETVEGQRWVPLDMLKKVGVS